jgi:hypothetical protein
VAGEEIFIDAGLVVEAVEEAGRDELKQVAVAFLVFAEEDKVVVAVLLVLDGVGLLGDVDFAADDGVNAFVLGGVVELDGAEEVAMISHGDGGHALSGDEFHELGDFAGAIEEGVIGVAVEVDKGFLGHRQQSRNRGGYWYYPTGWWRWK